MEKLNLQEFENIMEWLGFVHLEQGENSEYFALDITDDKSIEAEYYNNESTGEVVITLRVELDGYVVEELEVSEESEIEEFVFVEQENSMHGVS